MQFPDKAGGPANVPPPKEKKAPIIDGAELVKRPAGRRFFNFIFAESPKSLGSQVGRNVIIPQVKMAFEAAFNSFLSGMLWGNDVNRPMSNMIRAPMLRGNMTNYSVISSGGAMQQAQQAVVQKSSGNYQDVVVAKVEHAETLLAQMYEHLQAYSIVTVGDLYEWADIQVAISDNGFGWTSLEGARIRQVAGGFVLELPRPVLI